MSAVERFLDAVGDRDLPRIRAELADDVVLHLTFTAESVFGPDRVAETVDLLGRLLDDAEHRLLAIGPSPTDDGGCYAVVFSARLDGDRFDGVDLVHVDGRDRIRRLTTTGRPTSAAAELGERLSAIRGRIPGVPVVGGRQAFPEFTLCAGAVSSAASPRDR
jgi:hypothetical protein